MATRSTSTETPSSVNVFDFDSGGDQRLSVGSATSPQQHAADHDPEICGPEFTTLISRLAAPASWADKEMTLAVLAAKPKCRGVDGFMLELLTEALQRAGRKVEFCLTVPRRGSKSRQMLENLHHKYLKWQRESDGLEIVIEPRLREQFLITKPTPEYECLLAHVPEVFVGHPRRLRSLVEALCPVMAKVFAAKRQSLPPWRTAAAMLSKWRLSDAPAASFASSLLGLLQQPTLRLQPGQGGPVQGAHACVDDNLHGRAAAIAAALTSAPRPALQQHPAAPLQPRMAQPAQVLDQSELEGRPMAPVQPALQQTSQDLRRLSLERRGQLSRPSSEASQAGPCTGKSSRTRVRLVPRLEDELLPRRAARRTTLPVAPAGSSAWPRAAAPPQLPTDPAPAAAEQPGRAEAMQQAGQLAPRQAPESLHRGAAEDPAALAAGTTSALRSMDADTHVDADARPGCPLPRHTEEGRGGADQPGHPCGSAHPEAPTQEQRGSRSGSGRDSDPHQDSEQVQVAGARRTGSVRGREVFDSSSGGQQAALGAEQAPQRHLQHRAMQSVPLAAPLAAHGRREGEAKLWKSGDTDAPFTVHLHATSPPSDWPPLRSPQGRRSP